MKKTGRPKLPDGEAKGVVITFRLTEEENTRLTAEAQGQSVSDFIRAKLAIVTPNVWCCAGMRVETPSTITRKQWEMLKGYVEKVLEP